MTRLRSRSRLAGVHLSLEGFEPVDVAFGCSRALGQGEPGGDGREVLADPGSEGVQFGPVVDLFEPAGEVSFAGTAGQSSWRSWLRARRAGPTGCSARGSR
jgi:hypothetical protein